MINKIMPARTQEDKKFKLIADLDEFLGEVYSIKLLGKELEMKPIVGLQLKALDAACSKTLEIGKRVSGGENIPYEEIVKTYHDFCKLVIPDLTIQDLNKMTIKQVNHLLKVCFKFATQQEMVDPNETDQKKIL